MFAFVENLLLVADLIGFFTRFRRCLFSHDQYKGNDIRGAVKTS
jgi:hypothetical protein